MGQVIKDGDLFLFTDDKGDLPRQQGGFGLFRQDTRFLHRLEWSLGEEIPLRTLSVEADGAVSFYRWTQENGLQISGESIQRNTLEITRRRIVYRGVLYETFTFLNRGSKPVAVPLHLQFDADFADREDLWGNEKGGFGQREPVRWLNTGLIFDYLGGDGVQRSLEIQVTPAPDSPGEGGSLRIPLYIEPKIKKKVHLRYYPRIDEESLENFETHVAEEAVRKQMQEWIDQAPKVDSNLHDFNALYLQSVKDTRLLLMDWGEGFIPMTGLPWHAAPSGRWSLIASLQALSVDTEMAKNTVRTLARYQGKRFQPSEGEEPGKIPNQFRFGERSAIEGVSSSYDFTAIDTTALFLICIAQIYRWSGDIQFVREMMPAAQKALDWMDTYGDPGDFGYIAYQPGLESTETDQGWRSEETTSYQQGESLQSPLALIEVQSYVYRAKSLWVELYQQVGNTEEARRLHREAEALKKRFRQDFWSDGGIPVSGLDSNKKPLINDVTSNIGHGLLGGLYDQKDAMRIVERLFERDMFNGWGIRTLSSTAENYNPIHPYHGSIWLHDNAYILMGLQEMGFHVQMNQMIKGLLNATRYVNHYRYPAFFCGYGEEEGVLTSDSWACSPHAGSAGLGFVILQVILGIHPDASRRRLQLSPRLPDGMDRLTVQGLKVGEGYLDVELSRVNGATFLRLIQNTTGWSINCATVS
ncbi:glycogen debranching N-terminal domain-containing protein [Marininema halotolerans]|uniref:amylo-alpha-1,6-glucosidase n=1 Tax=Marininema halotolerans TaxID=1155944 RepID=UPI001595B97F|nr:glycogen debranching N-terminal domain-containing protein [Marininema halotolerans]